MDNEQQKPVNEEQQPVMVINIHSWGTLVLAIAMLVVGLLAGFAVRPYVLAGRANTSTNIAAAPIASTSEATPGQSTPSQPTPTSAAATITDEERQQLMTFVAGQTRHFLGNPDAPITLIEFSDFQ